MLEKLFVWEKVFIIKKLKSLNVIITDDNVIITRRCVGFISNLYIWKQKKTMFIIMNFLSENHQWFKMLSKLVSPKIYKIRKAMYLIIVFDVVMYERMCKWTSENETK